MTKENQNAQADQDQLESKAVAIVNTGPTGVMIGGRRYAVVQQVNVPILKHETGETVAVKIMQRINVDEHEREIEVKVDGETKTASQTVEINVVRVTELSTGQLFNLVLNAISASELKAAYPDHDYVGLCFAIKKLGLVAGKRYKDVQIVQIDHDGEVN